MDIKKDRYYIVSFGNSDRYFLHDVDNKTLANIEAQLNAFLKSKFPDETFAYYTTPKVDEVSDKNRDKYKSYPPLDAKAIESIKKVLTTEVADMEANRNLNSDAPFANVNPYAADLPHII